MDDIYSGVGILRRRDLDPEFSEREYLLDRSEERRVGKEC